MACDIVELCKHLPENSFHSTVKKGLYLTRELKHVRHHYRVNRRDGSPHACRPFTGPLTRPTYLARADSSARGLKRPRCVLTCRFNVQTYPLNHFQSRPQGEHVMMGRNWKLCRQEKWKWWWITSGELLFPFQKYNHVGNSDSSIVNCKKSGQGADNCGSQLLIVIVRWSSLNRI